MSTSESRTAVSGEEFTASLAEEIRAALDRLGQLSAAGEAPKELTIDRLLRIALKNELEASEIAAVWMTTTSELDVKLAFARPAGDEAKHYRLLAERLSASRARADTIHPRAGGCSASSEYLRQLPTTPARAVAGRR